MQNKPITVVRSVKITVAQAEFLRANAESYGCNEAELLRRLLNVGMGLKDQIQVPQGRPPRIPAIIQQQLDEQNERIKELERVVLLSTP